MATTTAARVGQGGLDPPQQSVLDDLGEEVTGIMAPVSICMALTVLLVRVLNPEGASSSATVYIASLAYDEQASDSTGQKLGGALLNAVVFVAIVGGMTFVLFLLFKYKFYRTIYAYMGVAMFNIFFFLTGVVALRLLQAVHLHMDAFSFCYLLFNFSVVGVLGLFFFPIPLLMKQSYLVWVGVVTAFVFTYIPEWTAWVLLVMMAVYDLVAVLVPGGPLKVLVELAIERNQELPALVYESRPARGPYQRGQWRAPAPGPHQQPQALPLEPLQQPQQQQQQQQQVEPRREAPPGGFAARLLPVQWLRRSDPSDRPAPSPTASTALLSYADSPGRSPPSSRQPSSWGAARPGAAAGLGPAPPGRPAAEGQDGDGRGGRGGAVPAAWHPDMPWEQHQRQRQQQQGPVGEGREAGAPAPAPVQAGLPGPALAAAAGASSGGSWLLPGSAPSPQSWSGSGGAAGAAGGPSSSRRSSSAGGADRGGDGLRNRTAGGPGANGQSSAGGASGGSVGRSEPLQGAPAQLGQDPPQAAVTVVARAAGGDDGAPGTQQQQQQQQQRLQLQEEEEEGYGELPDGIKLGLGDFIFYSMLVGRAAMYDLMTVFASYLAIIAGLGTTLLLLAVARKALPALPVSIVLGVVFYFLTRFTLEPFLVPLAINQAYY